MATVLPLARPALARPRSCVLGGVCAAMAVHLGWSPTATRWLTVGLSLCGGAGILLYAWLWATVRLESGDRVVHRVIPVAWLLLALAVVARFAILIASTTNYLSAWSILAGTAAIVALALAAVAWDQFVEHRDAAEARSSRAVRLASGVFLLLLAPLVTVGVEGRYASFLVWIQFTMLVIAGLTVLLGPWALRLWQELLAERTKRVREEQRAEIAAHLHDSVLQTLALIQNRAGASSEVARLARAQERELRDWLYAGGVPPESDLVTDVRDFAAALELDYAVRVEVVSVGEAVERAGGEVAAAAREAMLNAARHAGGDVTVYVESAPGYVDVFVRDRGPGFDPAAVPDDRLGVRESILGRMKRAGGSATVQPGVGGTGTEVHLHLERAQAQAGT